FGTGYSSIGYLRSFALDKIKLDRSMVEGIDRDDQSLELVRASVILAQALDLRVTAEGVESESEARLLRDAGCAELQGWFLAETASPAELDALFARGGGGALTGTG
ncbi:MAG: EAL domain-containing protein, partial [Bauldia litoralis]